MAVTTLSTAQTLFLSSASNTYSVAREGTGPDVYESEFGLVGQYLGGVRHEVNEVFARFDLSSIPAGAIITGAALKVTLAESYGTFAMEARAASGVGPFVAGSQLGALTQLGSYLVTGAFVGTTTIPLSGFTRANLMNVVFASAPQRTGTPTTNDDTARITSVQLEVTFTPPTPNTFQTISAPGDGVWTSPVTGFVTVEAHGGGGGQNFLGASGGGAYAALTSYPVVAGQNYTYRVGRGGFLLTNESGTLFNNEPGQDTWFVSTTTLLAKAANGATGGQASASIGDEKYSGGNAGSSNSWGFPGGGGAAATKYGPGQNGFSAVSETATSGAGGGAPGGGAGGVNDSTGANRHGVSNPTGGGGGGSYHYNIACGNGGAPGGGKGGSSTSFNDTAVDTRSGNGQLVFGWYVDVPINVTTNGTQGSLAVTGRQGNPSAGSSATGSRQILTIMGRQGLVEFGTPISVAGQTGAVTSLGMAGAVTATQVSTPAQTGAGTWDTVAKSYEFLLSNGNLTATHGRGYNASGSIYGSDGITTGDHSFKVTVHNPVGGIAIGIGNRSRSMTATLGWSVNDVGINSTGAILYAGTTLGNIGAINIVGTVVEIRIKDQKFYARKNGGDWNGSAGVSPEAGNGGNIAAIPNQPIYPLVFGNNAGLSFTGDFTAWNASTGSGTGSTSVFATSVGAHVLSLTGRQGSQAITFDAFAYGQAGSLSITGRQGSANANVTGTGSKGSLAISGYPGNVTLSTAVTGVAGTISLAGLSGTVFTERNVIVSGQAGSITLTPFQGSTNADATIMGDAGSLTVSGYPATVAVNLSVQSSEAASLTLSGASGAYRVDHSTTGNLGGLVIAGYAASVISTDNVSVAGSNAVLTITGRQGTMVFTSNPTVSGGKGAISINGHQGSVGTNTQVQGSASALQINGLAGSVTSTVQIDGTAQSVALTGRFGAARIDHTVSGGRQSMAVLGRQATVGSTVSATGGTQALQIVGHAASVFESDNVSVVANGAALTVTGYAGSIVNNINLDAGFDTLSISEFEGRTDASVNLTAGVRQSLQITGYIAEVDSRVVVPVFGFTGALTVTGRQGEVSTSVAVESVGQSLSITGRVGDTNAEVTVLGASTGTVSTTGRQGSTNSGAEIIAFPGSVSITGHNASIYEEDNFALTGGTGAMTVTGHAGRTDTDIILTGANDNVAITGFAGTAEATVSVTVAGQTGQIGLNGLVGSYGFGADVEGGAGSISITSYPASIIVSQNPVGESQDPLQIVGHVGKVEQAVYVFGQVGTVTLISLTGDTSIFDTISHVESAHRYTVRADKRKAEVNAQKRIATILAETRRVKAG
ncbi:MAG: beta strand repeat-containing protein [Brevundimonas mediterranea]|uniref:beta strand repeat-containing protein n=1 Tax=Brevundimonas mediterranea TaxID=74329 RepID=UPI0040349D83